MKKLKISKVWIAMTVVVIIAVAAWALSGGKEKEEINFKQEKVSLQTLQNLSLIHISEPTRPY